MNVLLNGLSRASRNGDGVWETEMALRNQRLAYDGMRREDALASSRVAPQVVYYTCPGIGNQCGTGFLLARKENMHERSEVYVFTRAYMKQNHKPRSGDPAKQEDFANKRKENMHERSEV